MLPARLQIALARWDLEIARGDADAAQRAHTEARRAWHALRVQVPIELHDSFFRTALARRVNDHA
jgi:hypothetical protein